MSLFYCQYWHVELKYHHLGIDGPLSMVDFCIYQNVEVVIATQVMKVSISSRELEILRKSADGLTVQQIANDLNVPEQDISKTQKKVLQKIGTGNVLNALQVLAKRGFVLAQE